MVPGVSTSVSLSRARAAQLLNPASRILVVGEMMLDEFIAKHREYQQR